MGGQYLRLGAWRILTLAATAVVLLAVFVGAQRRAAEPVLPLRIFTGGRNFPLASALLVVAGVAMVGGTLYLPLCQRTVEGASATNSGLLLLPMMIGTVIATSIAGTLMARSGRYEIFPVVGTVSLTLGMVLLAAMDSHTSRILTSACTAPKPMGKQRIRGTILDLWCAGRGSTATSAGTLSAARAVVVEPARMPYAAWIFGLWWAVTPG
ncbi:hypothetical protein [Nocardia sp. NPDC051570]|uniref:hypothetical protein n=1 Tax=Nocardia sp. NPDC051570 TaxID=3364324 RepID=UPI0037898CBA